MTTFPFQSFRTRQTKRVNYREEVAETDSDEIIEETPTEEVIDDRDGIEKILKHRIGRKGGKILKKK